MKNWEQDDTFLSKWLAGQLSEEEKRAFESSEEGKEFVELINASKLLEPAVYDAENELVKLKRKIAEAPEKKPEVIWMHPGFRLAAAASVLLMIALVYYFSNSITKISTHASEQELVILPDGSEVRLNVASELTYDKKSWDKVRATKLKGEGYFKVKEGVSFTVDTPEGTVSVLGTSFNIRNRREVLAVKCYSGKVEVTSDHASRYLTKGMVIKIKKGEVIDFATSPTASPPSWTRGITELEDTPLNEVLDELAIVFDLTIQYDGSLDHLIYNGAFPHQKPETAFKLVFDPLDIHYQYDQSSGTLIIQGLKP